jgi:hypothetical protein
MPFTPFGDTQAQPLVPIEVGLKLKVTESYWHVLIGVNDLEKLSPITAHRVIAGFAIGSRFYDQGGSLGMRGLSTLALIAILGFVAGCGTSRGPTVPSPSPPVVPQPTPPRTTATLVIERPSVIVYSQLGSDPFGYEVRFQLREKAATAARRSKTSLSRALVSATTPGLGAGETRS